MEYTYYAFISYKREDEKWAEWLQKKLESYGFPVALRKENPSLPTKIRPVFRDQSELSGGNLKEEIEKGLSSSKYLIVICSPRAARSPWVSKEVQYFIDHSRENSIIPFIIGGSPNAANPEDECFPEGLRQLPGEKEILGININEMGRDAAAIKVIARMFGLRFDTLWQRHERAKRRRRIGVIASTLLLAILGFAIGAYMVYINTQIAAERDRAEKQTVIAKQERNRANSERDRANTERDNALKANRDLAKAKDSIQLQSTLLAQTNRNLEESNRHLAEERDNVLKAKQEMMINHGRAVAEKARHEILKGNTKDAMLALLEVSSCSKDYPYIPEVEAALRVARDSLNGNRYNFQRIGGNIDLVLISDDGNKIVQISKDRTLECNTLTSLDSTKCIKFPEITLTNAYLSNDGNVVLLQDSASVYCYDIPKEELIYYELINRLSEKKIDEFRKVFMNPNFTTSGTFLNKTIHVDAEGNPKCEYLNEKMGIAILYSDLQDNNDGAVDELSEAKPIGLYQLYDIKNKKTICQRYNYEIYEGPYDITDMELSPDGCYWCIAYSNGSVESIDIQKNKSMIWEDPTLAGHYSNQIKFSKDSKLIFQTHAFQDCVNIIDVQQMSAVDSILTEESPEGADVYLMADNSILCHTSNRSYIYEKGRQCLETKIRKDSYSIDDTHGIINIKTQNGVGAGIYDIVKLDYYTYKENISRYEAVTGNTLRTEKDGFSIYKPQDQLIWKYENILEARPIAFTSDYRYGFIDNSEYRGGDYIRILDMSEGVPMIDFLCSSYADLYYSEEKGLIFIKGFDKLVVRDFPSYQNLVAECLQITRNMKLSKNNKRKFFLE